MDERRRDPRISVHISALVNDPPEEWEGFISDVSLGGMAIVCSKGPSINQRLIIQVEVEGQTIDLEVTVQWIKTMDLLNRNNSWVEFGTRIVNGSPKFETFVQKIMRSFSERRRNERFKSTIQVAFRSSLELVRDKSFNISQSGMFISSNHPPADDEKISLKLNLPQSEAVIVDAQVVHVNHPDKLKRGDLPGFGIHFLSFHDDGEMVYKGFLNQLRTKIPFVVE